MFGDLVALIGFGKEALESFFGNVGGYAFGIEPSRANLTVSGSISDREELDGTVFPRRPEFFQEQHGDGIGLLAGGAAGNPHAQGIVIIFCDQRRDNFLP